MPLVSIVVPAYNAEKFLGECLDSVRNQTLSDLEVIVVNDASSDSTEEIVGRYMAADERIRLLNLPSNRGLSGARNAGIEAARAEYVSFLDADDCLYPQAMELMYREVEGGKADVCRAPFVKGAEFRPRHYSRVDVERFDYRGAMMEALYQKTLMNPAWGMVIRRGLVTGAGGFREGIWYEDLDSFYRFYEKASQIAYIREPLYFYRQSPESFTGRWSAGRLDVLDVTDRMVEFFSRKDPELLKGAQDRRFSAHFNILLLMSRHGIKDEETSRRCLKVIREGRGRALVDRRVRLKNKIGALASFGGTPFMKLLGKFY